MRDKLTPSFEVEAILINFSSAIRRGRLLRHETQALAAQRANVSVATYVRMESCNIDQMVGIGLGSFLEALCAVGYQDALLAVGDATNDTDGARSLERKIPKRGTSLRKH